jgi:hypothetical protein
MTRAPPGSLSGGRSTMAEKSQRSRGSMGLDIGVSVLPLPGNGLIRWEAFTGGGPYDGRNGCHKLPQVVATAAKTMRLLGNSRFMATLTVAGLPDRVADETIVADSGSS